MPPATFLAPWGIRRKLLPLGAGTGDLALLRTIQDSGYRGPIGILNHTNADAEERLLDNLDGLALLTTQLEGKPTAKPHHGSSCHRDPGQLQLSGFGFLAAFSKKSLQHLD